VQDCVREIELEDCDVLMVGLGSTPGLRRADGELYRSLERAGAKVVIAGSFPPESVPTMMGTDLMWARAARHAARRMLDRFKRYRVKPPPAIYSTTTAALFWPLPGAIRFDAPAAANRPGRHGLWQRPLERRRLRQAPLLLPWSEGGLAEACAAVPGCADRALVMPAPIDPTPVGGTRAQDPGLSERDIAAVTYAGNPHKKGFDRVLAAWRRVRRPGERLVVVGITRTGLENARFELPDEDIDAVGELDADDLRSLLRRARAFVCAPRREDYGLIQLEALAEGCQLVSTPAPGPYVGLPIARRLDSRLVSEDLGEALRTALEDPARDYASRARAALEPFTREAVDRLVAEELLPRLLG
jgi:glycosyltransferase involved in cell wall biosynthesis